MFEKDAMIFDGGQIEEVWLCHKDRTPYVGLKCQGFPSFGIWSVKDAPFVCLEPWMGRCDVHPAACIAHSVIFFYIIIFTLATLTDTRHNIIQHDHIIGIRNFFYGWHRRR